MQSGASKEICMDLLRNLMHMQQVRGQRGVWTFRRCACSLRRDPVSTQCCIKIHTYLKTFMSCGVFFFTQTIFLASQAGDHLCPLQRQSGEADLLGPRQGNFLGGAPRPGSPPLQRQTTACWYVEINSMYQA